MYVFSGTGNAADGGFDSQGVPDDNERPLTVAGRLVGDVPRKPPPTIQLFCVLVTQTGGGFRRKHTPGWGQGVEATARTPLGPANEYHTHFLKLKE